MRYFRLKFVFIKRLTLFRYFFVCLWHLLSVTRAVHDTCWYYKFMGFGAFTFTSTGAHSHLVIKLYSNYLNHLRKMGHTGKTRTKVDLMEVTVITSRDWTFINNKRLTDIQWNLFSLEFWTDLWHKKGFYNINLVVLVLLATRASIVNR